MPYAGAVSPRCWWVGYGYVLRVAELNMCVLPGVHEEVLVPSSLLDGGRVVVVLLLPLRGQIGRLLQPLGDRCRLAVLGWAGDLVDEDRGGDRSESQVEAGLNTS